MAEFVAHVIGAVKFILLGADIACITAYPSITSSSGAETAIKKLMEGADGERISWGRACRRGKGHANDLARSTAGSGATSPGRCGAARHRLRR